jgi:hypothetical protein
VKGLSTKALMIAAITLAAWNASADSTHGNNDHSHTVNTMGGPVTVTGTQTANGGAGGAGGQGGQGGAGGQGGQGIGFGGSASSNANGGQGGKGGNAKATGGTAISGSSSSSGAEAGASSSAKASNKQSQGQVAQGSVATSTTNQTNTNAVGYAPVAPVFPGACSQGVSGQGMGFGGSVGTGNPVCDYVTIAAERRLAGDSAGAKAALDKAEDAADFRRVFSVIRSILTLGLL